MARGASVERRYWFRPRYYYDTADVAADDMFRLRLFFTDAASFDAADDYALAAAATLTLHY